MFWVDFLSIDVQEKLALSHKSALDEYLSNSWTRAARAGLPGAGYLNSYAYNEDTSYMKSKYCSKDLHNIECSMTLTGRQTP